jgi:ribosomal-protein-alanine N-acetyltransferase
VRRPERADQAAFLAAARASRALHRGLVEPPLTPAQFARFLARAEHPARECHLVCRREDGAICGVVNLNEVIRGVLQGASVGYYGFAPTAGQGLVAEGVELVLSRAFGRLRLHRVEAGVQPGNAASIALVRRLGFREEGFSPRYIKIGGRWRDHVRFAIDVDDWRRRRRAQPRSRR